MKYVSESNYSVSKVTYLKHTNDREIFDCSPLLEETRHKDTWALYIIAQGISAYWYSCIMSCQQVFIVVAKSIWGYIFQVANVEPDRSLTEELTTLRARP